MEVEIPLELKRNGISNVPFGWTMMKCISASQLDRNKENLSRQLNFDPRTTKEKYGF